jgi:hypothetical protein
VKGKVLETTERVVEAYVRYIKGWATIPNVKCPGQLEVDLLAIDPVTQDRYHIESGVSVSVAYGKLTTRPYADSLRKQRVKAAGQRRTMGYFIERKFGHPNVLEKLQEYGFTKNNYEKIIVSWGWTDEAEKVAKRHSITLWDFRKMMQDITRALRTERTYFTDDTMRILHLYSRAEGSQQYQEEESL